MEAEGNTRRGERVEGKRNVEKKWKKERKLGEEKWERGKGKNDGRKLKGRKTLKGNVEEDR